MKLRTSILGAALLLTASTVSALPITLTFASSLLSAQPGATVTFIGTVTETGGTTTFLLGDVVSVAPPLVADDTPFLNNFPPSLPAMQSVTADILKVIVPLATAPGIYNGTFAILGGEGTIASAPFAVNVGAAAVPEPVTLALLAIGVGALAVRRGRAVQRRR